MSSRDSHRESSSRFVANIVQAANRKIRKTAQRRSISSSLTPDTLSLDSMTTVSEIIISKTNAGVWRFCGESFGNANKNWPSFQSAESKDLQKSNKLKVKSNESLAETPRSSEDDFDSAFTENGENGKTRFPFDLHAPDCHVWISYFQFTKLFSFSEVFSS